MIWLTDHSRDRKRKKKNKSSEVESKKALQSAFFFFRESSNSFQQLLEFVQYMNMFHKCIHEHNVIDFDFIFEWKTLHHQLESIIERSVEINLREEILCLFLRQKKFKN